VIRDQPWLAIVAALTILVACSDGDDGGAADRLADRQAEVAERGADVMPFDLDATTHHFEPTDTGLVQTVTADDPVAGAIAIAGAGAGAGDGDGDQVELVRQHLVDEAERFERGDFGDPAAIHGHDMPGLAELEAGAGAITVVYDELPDGARLTYTTDDPALVDALHHWGEAQTSDHGTHAQPDA